MDLMSEDASRSTTEKDPWGGSSSYHAWILAVYDAPHDRISLGRYLIPPPVELRRAGADQSFQVRQPLVETKVVDNPVSCNHFI